tara:strand:- start:1915 stop:2934 length:1020 start_codon:yes stop_codon:yes gene_type:complete
MTISASGVVSAADIRTEFGFSGTVSFADLYRGGSHIRAKAANNNAINLAASVPTSGTITFDNFRGTAKAFRYTYTSGATNQNASALFGDDYAVNYPKEIVINSGVELGATSVTDEALQINSGASGLITVTNNGTLSGAGAAFLGSIGGDAFEANATCTLINNGIIRSGGGTGGSGGQGSYSSSSTPYWSGTYRWLSYGGANSSATGNRQVAVWGGSYVVNSYTTALSIGQYSRSSYVTVTFSDPVQWQYRITRTTTAYSNGGYGGAGQGYNQAASAGTSGGTNAGQGGTGGSYGQTGGTGVNGNYTNGTAGNAAGKAVKGIGVGFITFTDNGTTLGSTV